MALAGHHAGEPEVSAACQLLAQWSEQHVAALGELEPRFEQGEDDIMVPPPAAPPLQSGSYGLLLGLHSAWLLAQDVHLRWTVLGGAARALRDVALEQACAALGAESDRQVAWLRTRLVEAAPQALIAAP